MTRALHISLAVLLAAVVAGGAVIASGATTTSAKSKSPTLKLRKTSLGMILVDRRGRTLYEFGHDLKNKSRCSGACASNWPPASSPAKPTVAKGIAKSKLKVIKRANGSRQLSYNGHPLYRFVGDSKAGDTNGENIVAFGGKWDVLSKSGAIVTKAPSSSSSTSSGGNPSPAPSPYPGY
jgi:predicted lipoprotein with Yx(FWY)xxD motif